MSHEPLDPEPPAPTPRAEFGGHGRWAVLGVIAAGGAAGATARHGAEVLWPAPPGGFPWAVLGVNLLGCALIGVLMPLVAEGGRSAHPLVRPCLGVGVLGGFTTFSAYASGTVGLLEHGRPGPALLYAAGTAAGALLAVGTAARATRAVLGRAVAG
ncbi:fluoride efflux transporter FluC [Streptomyces sp. t39]|uniref:fluoride efflux transporter FluC n=1 Tax=Streptomyces sp. t39 TaxID=1828156 RepID=UPI0011CE9520|nr:CrcB family protein [Streptomyces sp. t39]TXS55842.1 CrcB family protein [Streptomyces sp. t39]